MPPKKDSVTTVEKKLSIWEKIKHEAVHYWQGTKLLGAEVKISSRLLVKLVRGNSLSRKEMRQVCRHIQVTLIALTIDMTAQKNCDGSLSTRSIPHHCSHSLPGAPLASHSQALSQHAPIDF
jgi:hypothetical protein